MSKKNKSIFEAADIRRRVEAEAERDVALAEVARLRAAAAAPPPAPPPPAAAPSPPPPETPLAVYRRMKVEARPNARAFAAAYFFENAHAISSEIYAEQEAKRKPPASPPDGAAS